MKNKKRRNFLQHILIYSMILLHVWNGIWNIHAENLNETYLSENLTEIPAIDGELSSSDDSEIETASDSDIEEKDEEELPFTDDECSEPDKDSDFNVEDPKLIQQEHEEQTEGEELIDLDETVYTEELYIISEENAELLDAKDEESQKILEQILEGEALGFVSMEDVDFDEGMIIETEIIDSDMADIADDPNYSNTIDDEWLTEADEEWLEAEEETMLQSELLLAGLDDTSYNLINGSRIYCDEVWTKANDYINGNRTRMSTTYRVVTYTDIDGNVRRTPIYCMNSMKDSIPGGTIDSSGIESVTNANIKKLLYFGYGGPGDYCDNYDPTCSHIDWSNWHNRYVFTHQAISKTYANDVGGATAAEIEHVGLNRFITRLTSLTLPTRKATLLNAVLPSGERVIGQNVSVEMPLYHGYSDYKTYMPSGYKNGYYLTEMVIISDAESSQHGIVINHKASSRWTVFYWTSYDDYVQRGINNPRVCSGDQVLKLKHSARFRVGLPANSLTPLNFTFKMIQNPVSYLLVDTSDIYHDSRYQDFGAAVYEGEKGQLNLIETQTPQGSLQIMKTDSATKEPVENAQYSLYADENLVSAGRTVYQKGSLIDQKTTNTKGQIVFSSLIPGKYYVKETKTPSGYQLDANTYPVTVNADITDKENVRSVLQLTDDPEVIELGEIVITKCIYASDIVWAHGNPTFQFCVEGVDENGKSHTYQETIMFDERDFGTGANMENNSDAIYNLNVKISDIPFGTYKIIEYPTLRYYLEKIEAGSSNTTIHQISEPRPGVRPEDIAYASVLLTEREKTAAATFYNKKVYHHNYSHTSTIENYIPIPNVSS